jgi:hypothetical protein
MGQGAGGVTGLRAFRLALALPVIASEAKQSILERWRMDRFVAPAETAFGDFASASRNDERAGGQARSPMKVESPKAPSVTVPASLSPSTLPLKVNVIGMGEVMSIDQLASSPETAPLSIACEP